VTFEKEVTSFHVRYWKCHILVHNQDEEVVSLLARRPMEV